MFKRMTALALCLMLAVSLLPSADAFGRQPIAPESVDRCCHTLRVDALDPNYVRPAYDGKLIELTPQRVEDTFDYLDEHYVKNHPEQALMVYTGTEEDQLNLLKLAQTITAGCRTDREKADAIGSWLSRNITYDVKTSAYASDTFYRREGNCLSYANLMMFLLRSLGIPAVVGDGWRGDMEHNTADLFGYEGHAWVFVRLDGQWVLYDPLWLDGGTTDRDYMAKNIYFNTVEFVTPASDGDNLPPVIYDDPVVYCTDGKYYMYSDFAPNGVGTLTAAVNNQIYVFVTNQCEGDIGDGRYYMDGRDKSGMTRGEVYRDGWVSYGEYSENRAMSMVYAFPNGMMPDGYVLELDGRDWYMSYDSAKPILMDEEDYWIEDGLMTVRPGYCGPFLGVDWQEGCLDSRYEYIVTWESRNPEIVSVDQSGNITCHQAGYADIYLALHRVERNGNLTLLSDDLLNIFVCEKDRIPDFGDHAPCAHHYELNGTVDATCTDRGYEIWICSLCGNRYTEDLPIDPEAHAWEGTECTLCGDTRLTPFDDVTEGQFYEIPVAWAVEMGVTSGASANTFEPYSGCNRSQVVTFLWRAAGRPDPKGSSNPFVDVEKGSFYEKAVLWAVERGITAGLDSTHFGPNDLCNRSQVVTFLWRAARKPASGSGSNPFSDVFAEDWYMDAVLWAVEQQITAGLDSTHFGPNDPCNRSQVVTFLYRAFAE